MLWSKKYATMLPFHARLQVVTNARIDVAKAERTLTRLGAPESARENAMWGHIFDKRVRHLVSRRRVFRSAWRRIDAGRGDAVYAKIEMIRLAQETKALRMRDIVHPGVFNVLSASAFV